MLIQILIFLGIGITFGVGFLIFSIIAKKRNEKIVRNFTKEVSVTLRCPKCNSVVNNKIEEKSKQGFEKATIKCDCGHRSTWDVMGNPPVLLTPSTAKVVAGLRDRMTDKKN